MEGSGLMAIDVQSVGIPNTGGKRGGFPSTVPGVIAGDAVLDMEVLSKRTEAAIRESFAAWRLFQLASIANVVRKKSCAP